MPHDLPVFQQDGVHALEVKFPKRLRLYHLGQQVLARGDINNGVERLLYKRNCGRRW